MTSVVELQRLGLTDLTRSAELVWSEAVQNIDFSHFSRKAWSIVNNLTGRSRHFLHHCSVPANVTTAQLLKNELYNGAGRESTRLELKEVSDRWSAQTATPINISGNFSETEFAAALQNTKPSKTPGPDSICTELIIHAGADLKSWLHGFFFSCLRHIRILKVWRRALAVAIPKPSKLRKNPKSYLLLSLLYVPYRILERLIHARVEPIINPPIPTEQTGFWRGRSILDQTILLTKNI